MNDATWIIKRRQEQKLSVGEAFGERQGLDAAGLLMESLVAREVADLYPAGITASRLQRTDYDPAHGARYRFVTPVGKVVHYYLTPQRRASHAQTILRHAPRS